MKLGEVVVPMDTTTSPSFIKIGLKTKKFSHEPISGTFECGVNNRTVEVHHLRFFNFLYPVNEELVPVLIYQVIARSMIMILYRIYNYTEKELH